MPAHTARRTFTVDEYHKMAASDIFQGERVELVEGEVLTMAPMGSRHAACIARLTQKLTEMRAPGSQIRVQLPVQLSPFTELEPDIAVVRARDDFYSSSHPGREDLLLVIEVAESSLTYDRDIKFPVYARSGVPEAWLVDLAADRIELHSGPTADGNGTVELKGPGDVIASRHHPWLALNAELLLG